MRLLSGSNGYKILWRAVECWCALWHNALGGRAWKGRGRKGASMGEAEDRGDCGVQVGVANRWQALAGCAWRRPN